MLKTPCETRFLQLLLLDGLERLLSRPAVNRKESITADILFAIFNKFNNVNVNDLRLCSMMVLT